MAAYQLAQPILDNRAAFRHRYPGAAYVGDVGDKAHQSGTGDHTPHSSDAIFGVHMSPGWVYAQDFGNGAFDLATFTRWLLIRLRAGLYPEVKYVISRLAANKGVAGGTFYGLFDRRYNWRTQLSRGHTSHIHISYMPGYERSASRIIEDYWLGLHLPLEPDPKWKRWAKRPALPTYGLGQYSTRTLATLPYTAYPPLVLGYGGSDAPQAQQDIVSALQRYAITVCRTTMITAAEVSRAEIGAGTLAFAKMVTTLMAGNAWSDIDQYRNSRAFGASIGAPASW